MDMGEPVLDGPTVPTTLAPTREGGRVVAAPIDLGGQRLSVTAVSMGNPHAVVFMEVRVGTGLNIGRCQVIIASQLRHGRSTSPARASPRVGRCRCHR